MAVREGGGGVTRGAWAGPGKGKMGQTQRNSTVFHVFKFFQTKLNLIRSKVIFWYLQIFK
jgi:hypothetical protein